MQVSFAKEPYKTDALLQKRPEILLILLTVATAYACNPVLNFRTSAPTFCNIIMPSTSAPLTFTMQLFLDFLFFPVEIFVIFGLFLLTFSELIFFIPAGWSNVLPASLRCTAYCIWSVISLISNRNQLSSSLVLFCHVPLKRDQGD